MGLTLFGAPGIVMQLTTSAAPLSPAAAAEILRTCACLSNRTNAWVLVPDDRPISMRIHSDAQAGPFGPLRSTPSRRTCCEVYAGGLPRFGPRGLWSGVTAFSTPPADHSRGVGVRATPVPRPGPEFTREPRGERPRRSHTTH